MRRLEIRNCKSPLSSLGLDGQRGGGNCSQAAGANREGGLEVAGATEGAQPCPGTLPEAQREKGRNT